MTKTLNHKDGKSNHGLIHVISGNGKGKTTSALGLALRASGHGFRTLIIQFMKKGWDYGELVSINQIPLISIIQFGTPEFVDKNNPKDIDFQEARAALAYARKVMSEEDWDILVLDEINVALNFGLISEEEVLSFLQQKPKKLEVLLTGRYASPALIELADYYTEISTPKHPFQSGILARKGIEF
ncbi:MAG: cob(I)yrinic acid a,c-diamide adenosyltransferase [Candidatus Heimdallarchaeota archaeon]|nr:cob(I)yrinic acid a,c-diamide adenosyltransferase [Candidatus Heimdallarchaeota archaeon]